MNSIGRRIFLSNFIVVFLTIILFEVIFGTGVNQFYYGGALRVLTDKALSSANFYNMYLKYEPLENKAVRMIENYREREVAELQVVDTDGRILMSSSGFLPGEKVDTSFHRRLNTGETHAWRGKLAVTGEEVLAVTTPLVRGDAIVGYLRLVSSLEEIRSAVRDLVSKAVILGGLILILSLVLAVVLSRTIVRPIRHLTGVSREIAGGNLDVVAGKRYNDEIGELADTINFMSEELKKSNRLKNDFISSISHEIRTPLTSIRGWAETLHGNSKDYEETRQGIHIILRESERLTKLVEELLDFSRFESGRFNMNFEKVDLNSLIKEVLKQYKVRFESKNLKLETCLDDRVTFVNGDPDRLKQVFINILDNACKFSKVHEVISVVTENMQHKVKICFEDHGEGIPEDELPHVMEKFYKGKSRQSGSGLGLSISREIIRLHKGEMRIDSTEGKGTKVTIELLRE